MTTRREALEEAALLHDSIDPACDHERQDGVPGAGAMGAIIEYRDKIRALAAAPADASEEEVEKVAREIVDMCEARFNYGGDVNPCAVMDDVERTVPEVAEKISAYLAAMRGR